MYQVLFAFVFTFLFTLSDEQLLKTSLQVTVRNELGNLQEGVDVQLYESAEDYNNNENAIGEKQITDSKGRANFKNLESKVYFVNAEKGEANNFGGAEKTETLAANKVNKVTIIIE